MDRTLIALQLRGDESTFLDRVLTLLPGTVVELLHVAAPEPDFVGFGPGPSSVRDSLAAQLHAEHLALEHLAERARAQGHEARMHLVRAPTTDGILAEAARLGAARIVARRRDRGAAATALLGSTTRDLLRRSTLPVLILPP